MIVKTAWPGLVPAIERAGHEAQLCEVVEPDATCDRCGHRGDAHTWGYECDVRGCRCQEFRKR